MNDDNELHSHPNDDAALERALSRLRSLEPPPDARIKNRAAVAAALRSLTPAEPRHRLPWWHRSVSVPVPIAASVVLMFALAVAVSFRIGEQQYSAATVATRNAQPEHADGSRASGTVAPGRPEGRPDLVYRETATYVCGIGQVKSTHGYFFKEQDR